MKGGTGYRFRIDAQQGKATGVGACSGVGGMNCRPVDTCAALV